MISHSVLYVCLARTRNIVETCILGISHIVSTQFDFAKEEEKVIQYWREIDAFQTSLKLAEGRPEYSFYDGPPFATGLPHYGHLLAGTIKVCPTTTHTSTNGARDTPTADTL